ncbi:MAG: HlyD family secretion protein, partial [Candidatus Acidiferrales bacterium]
MNLASVKSLFRNHRRPAMLVSLALAAVLVFTAFRLGRSNDVQYFTAPVEQGEVLTVVNATGTIDAVTTVEVGSQVSGMIKALHADFNSEVKKGQIIAQIDPAQFRARVVQAQADLASARAGVKSLQADLQVTQANVEKNQAALRESELKLRRMLELFEQGIASVEQRDSVQVAQETAVANLRAAEAQVNQTRARIEQQQAQVTQRQAQLEQTGFDLQRATIRAPINGTVIARNVDVGQTVAASLQAP